MLEIVHDIAPGAALGFATATTSEASFAQNILDLRNLRGCNIIVDDIIYLDESPFQDGPVAQAVNQVTTSGALYFSSAGNENNKNDTTSGTWEGFFNGNGNLDSLLGAGAGTTHNFGDGGQSLLVEVASGDPPLLIWNDPYGTSANDYDLYDCDGGLTTVFDFSFDTQDGDDDPIEFISGGTFSGERLVVTQFAGADRMLNLIVFRGEVDGTLSTSAATRGHSAAVDAFSVAAAPAAAAFGPGEPTGPFPGPFTAAQLAETFSSDGLRRVYYDFGGNFLGTPGDVSPTGGVVRQKPDITAADGVATSAPGFNPFYGTSAAAPHAAAIAALVKQAFPAFTNAQIRTALQNSAIDIELPGVDRDTGYGIVMAYNTLVANGAPLVANLALGTVTPAQLAGDGDAYIEPNEDWNLTINLQNVGAVGATAISATLSTSTPGVAVFARPSEGHRAASPVAVNASTATYPNIGVGGNANNSVPFSFTDLSVGCGQRINFTLTVTYTGGLQPQQSFNFSLLTGSPGAPVTISYTGPAVFIPDGTGLTGTMPGAPVNASLLVAGVGPLYDVDFRFDGATCSTTIGSTTVGLDHTFVHDLDIVLRSPATTTVLMIDNTDGSGNNFCQTYLDDESAGASIQTVVSANAPFTGSFKPANFLSAFDGQNADGTWQLQAQDFFGGDTGNIRAWSLILTPAVCNAPALTSAVTATKAVTGGTLLAGGTVVYTVTLTNTGTGSVIDNAGNEFTDTLPPSLTLVTATASSGTATMAGNVVNWNGGIPPAGVVTITITANINGGAGLPISNQGTVSFDANRDGVNGDGSAMTNDPATAAPNDPTVFTPLGLVAVPALSTIGLAILAAALALVAVTVLRLRLTR